MSVFFSTEAGNATGSGDVDEFAFAYLRATLILACLKRTPFGIG